MRICAAPLCDNTATVWYHGAWCGKCATRRFGKTPALEARLGDLRHALKEVAPAVLGAAAPDPVSPPRGQGPAPLSDGDIEQLLARHNWDLLDLEWALVAHLEEP